MSLKEDIKSYTNTGANTPSTEEGDIMSDMRYVCQSCSLITGALQRGCDVLQLPDGDIIITELKPVTFQYTWDDKKGKLVRTQAGVKLRKTKTKANEDSTSKAKNEELETVS